MSKRLEYLMKNFPSEQFVWVLQAYGKQNDPERMIAIWGNQVHKEVYPLLNRLNDLEKELAIAKKEIEFLSVED